MMTRTNLVGPNTMHVKEAITNLTVSFTLLCGSISKSHETSLCVCAYVCACVHVRVCEQCYGVIYYGLYST